MIEVQIPFQGFYETDLADLADREPQVMGESLPEDSEVYPHDYVNYLETYLNIAKAYTEEWLALKGYQGEFVELGRPREYNFSTDRIFVNIPKEALEPLQAYKYEEGFADWVQDNYTSRPGFISFVEPNVDLWDDVFSETEYTLVLQYLEEDRELEEEILENLQGQEYLVFDYDSYYSALAQEALELGEKAKKAEATREEIIKLLAEETGNETTDIGTDFRLTKRVTKTTAYKAAVEKYAPAADLSEFQKESTNFILRRIK